MTPEQVTESTRDVVVVNHEKTALEISFDLKESTKENQRLAFAGSRNAGFFYLHRIDKHPDMVYECVVSQEGDAITSVYRNHRIFQNHGELIKARVLLINAVAQKVGLSPEGVGVDDPGRGRVLGLVELSTGQLIDMLSEKIGQSIVTTDSHSAAGLGGINV